MKSTACSARGRIRLVAAASMMVLLAACGSGDGSGVGLTLPADVSIVRPTQPAEPDAVAPPAETAAPENPPAQPEPTAAPETQPPEQPLESAAPVEEPVGTVAPADDGEGTVWWPWVLVALVVIGAIAAIASRRRRPNTSWQLQATTLLDEIDQLTIHLAALTPGGLQAVAQSDAMRLATMRATLAKVIATAPNGFNQAALNRLTTPIASLHGAVDAVAMSADPSAPPVGASVSQLATQLHTSSASVRAELAMQP